MLDWEWISEPNTLALWIYILLSVNYKPNSYKGIKINEGEMITSVSTLSFKTGLTTQQTRTALSKLESTNEITRKTTNNYTIIRVNKWSQYQTDNKQITSESTSQLTTLKEYKEVKEGKKDISKELDCSPEFSEALDAFEEMRKKIKKPLTNRAKQMVLTKLCKLAMDEKTQIEILNQSTMNGWQDVYPLKDTPRSVQTEKRGLEALMNI